MEHRRGFPVGHGCCVGRGEPGGAAQEKPFQIYGTGEGPQGLPLPGEPARPHWAVGKGSFLGHYHGAGSVESVSAVPQSDGDITGGFHSGEPFVFVGEDGDKLACEYGLAPDGSTTGTFTLVPVAAEGPGFYVAIFVAEFVPVTKECTGKFRGVTGGWTMYAVSLPFLLGSSNPLYYSWEGQGALIFK